MRGKEYFKEGSKYKDPEVGMCVQSSRKSRRLMEPTDRGDEGQVNLEKK